MSALIRMFAGRWRPVLLALVLLAGLGRSLSLVLADPLLGYANNYDFMRVQSCFDIWPTMETDAAGAHHWMPASAYHYGHKLSDEGCLLSSGLLFFQAAIWLDQAQNMVQSEPLLQLKWVGLVHTGALFLLAALLTRRLYMVSSPAAFANALGYALILADPFNTLYANTLYLESSALLFMYGALVLSWLVAVRPGQPKWVWWLLALVYLGLGTSKTQYMFHLGLLALLVVLWLYASRRVLSRRVLAVLPLCVLVPILFHGYAQSQSSFLRELSLTNRTNVFLELVLGNAADKSRTTALLGLPEHCAALAGKSRFHPVHREGHQCPEVGEVSRARLIPALVDDPMILPRAMPQVLLYSQEWIATKISMVHGVLRGRLDFSLQSAHPSIGAWIASAPQETYITMAIVGSYLSIVVLLWVLCGIVRNQLFEPVDLAVLLFGGAAHLVFAASVLGDGFPDLGRHQHLYNNMLLPLLLLGGYRFITGLCTVFRR